MGSKWMLYVGLNFFNSSQVNIIKKLLKARDQNGCFMWGLNFFNSSQVNIIKSMGSKGNGEFPLS